MPVNYGDLAASVAKKRLNKKKPSDNITTENGLFHFINESKNFKIGDFSGNGVTELFAHGVLDDTGGAGTPKNIGWYNPYEVFNPNTAQDYIDGGTFDFKQLGAMITFTGADQIRWSGKEKAVELVSSRLDVADKNLQNKFAAGLFDDGTSAGGRSMGGLQLLVQDDPTAAGTVGGIDQVANPFWQNTAQDNLAVAVSSSNVVSRMNGAHLSLVRGDDKPDVIICDDEYFRAYEDSQQANGRFTSRKLADAGFQGYEYKGIPVLFDSNCPAKHMYMLNSKYLHVRYAKGRWFEPEEARKVVLGDSSVMPIWTAANMTCSNRKQQAVIFNS